MDILDDPSIIRQRDHSDALGLAETTLDQLDHDFGIEEVTPPQDIRNVVFAGMGGSALQAELVRTWPKLSVPFMVWRSYGLPDFVDEHTLVIVSSYSGNTEETLSSYEEARSRGSMLVVMAGGGRLDDVTHAMGDRLVVLPKAVQPRMAMFYGFRALMETLVAYRLVDRSILDDLSKAAGSVRPYIERWIATVPSSDNPAKRLAFKLAGTTPIIYGGPLMASAAYKWKINCNENAKNTAWWSTLPEFDHNEYIGWTSHPVEKPFSVIDLVSSFEHPRIIKRFEVAGRLLSGKRPAATTVEAQGDTPLEHLLYLLCYGDFVTLYLGILNGVDPSPVDAIEKFKNELG